MRAIIVIFKDRIEGFTSLQSFLSNYPEFEINYEAIVTAISRKKIAYENSDFKLIRLNLKKAKNKL